VEDKGQKIVYEWLVRPFMTHHDIAGITGTSRQTVTTTLNEFRNNNLLIFDRNRLLVRNLETIRSIAQYPDQLKRLTKKKN
jgi:CRP-like cAMP-binding protein